MTCFLTFEKRDDYSGGGGEILCGDVSHRCTTALLKREKMLGAMVSH